MTRAGRAPVSPVFMRFAGFVSGRGRPVQPPHLQQILVPDAAVDGLKARSRVAVVMAGIAVAALGLAAAVGYGCAKGQV